MNTKGNINRKAFLCKFALSLSVQASVRQCTKSDI